MSEPVLIEILEVLAHPELTRKFCSLSGLDMRRILDVLAQASAVDVPTVPPVSRDPNDDKFLATALAAHAHYLVSEDKDLLDLEEYRGVRIASALRFLELLQHGQSQA